MGFLRLPFLRFEGLSFLTSMREKGLNKNKEKAEKNPKLKNIPTSLINGIKCPMYKK